MATTIVAATQTVQVRQNLISFNINLANQVSALAICNQALLQLGAAKINSFTDGTVAGTLCNDLWPTMRDKVLRVHPWNCIIKRATLSTSTTPTWGYKYAFTLPTDCLRLLEVDIQSDHKVENGKILTDESSVNIKYIYKENDSTKYDSLLISTLVACMAAELAYPITRSESKAAAAFQIFAEKLRLARMVDAQEDSPDTLGDFPFINNR